MAAPSTALGNPPDTLKQIKPYITLAAQLEQRNEKAIAYYCRVYSVQTGMNINKTAQDCKNFLLKLMDHVETTKANNKNDEAIQSDTVGQSCVEGFALNIFETADTLDRQGKFDKNLVKQFYTAGLLFDVLSYFGDVADDDIIAKKQYAKRKAMYLNKCFQTGETPIPGPLVDAEDPFGGANNLTNFSNDSKNASSASNTFNTSDQNPYPTTFNNKPPSPVKPPTTTNFTSPTTTTGGGGGASAAAASYGYEDTSSSSNQRTLSPSVIQRAQKACKFASSALQYDDVDTAVKHLEECLQLLKTGK